MSVAAILQQLAENAGRARLQQGQIYGNLVSGVSQIPAQIMEDRERQATIDLQRAQALATMRYAQNRDVRETADQAYQDQTRAQELEKQTKVRAIIGAYTAGTPNDPSTNNLAAGIAKAREVGLPEFIPNLWELHTKELAATNPRPYETDPTKDQRSPITNEILTPGQPKMPEIGTDAYERAIAIRALTNPGGAAPGAPASSVAPPPGAGVPTYAGRLDALQTGPPPSTVPAGGPGAPATTAAPPAAPTPPIDYGYGNRYGTTTPKGLGYLGPLQRPDNGKTMSEYSIGVNIGGKETQIPSIVPTLTKEELASILTAPEGTPPSRAIQQKAADYAKQRIANGLDPFAGPGEQQNLYPELARNAIPPIRPATSAPGAPPLAPGAPVIAGPPAAAAPPRSLTMAEATAKVYADSRAAAEAAKDPHSAIYKEWQDYTKQGGALGFDAYMTMDANRKKPVVSLSGMNALYSETDPKAIAAAIMRGEREPETGSLGRPIGAAVDSELAKAGYNKAQAITDWKATQRHIATLNNGQQLRLNQSINALPEMLDSVDKLASQWKGGQFPILNRANLALAKNGAYGSEVASVARQLDAQIADVTADLGNVYMGGNSPTDHALGLAAKSLAGEWDQKVLHDMVGLARNNVKIRSNSIANTGVAGASPTNPYAPPAAPAPAATAPIRQPIPGMPGALAESTDGGKTWKRVQ